MSYPPRSWRTSGCCHWQDAPPGALDKVFDGTVAGVVSKSEVSTSTRETTGTVICSDHVAPLASIPPKPRTKPVWGSGSAK